MEQELLLKAATSAVTDQGTFTAVISTATVDRDKDIVEPSAVVGSLQKWAALGKRVPLLWDHTKNVVGHIDPSTARVEGTEVVADGYVDQAAKGSAGENFGEQTWRLVKSGTLSFSFGFLFEPKADAEKLAGGRYRIKNLDVYEVSVIPVAPANNDTRVLSFKSAESIASKIEALEQRITALEAQKSVDVTEPEGSVDPQPRSEDPDARDVSATQPPSPEDVRADAMRRAFEDMHWSFVETR